MKKLYVLLLMLVLVVPAIAQTDFRHITYKDAIAAAKLENKLVFIDFYTSWCGPCKMMVNNVFPLKKVGDYFNSTFVCIKIDAEKGEGVELAKRYGVKAYPTFFAIDTNEKIVMKREGGCFDGDQFVNIIKRLIDPEKTPERMQQRYEDGERTADLISAYASLKMEQAREGRRLDKSKEEEAFRMVEDYFYSLKEKERLAPENVFIYTTYTKHPSDSIVRYMIAHRNQFASVVKNQIADRIAELYKNEIKGYLSAKIPFDQKQYEITKKEIQDLNLNRDDCYTTVFRLLDCYGKGNLKAFIALCGRKYDKLTEEFQFCLMSSFSSLINTKDEIIRKQAIDFVRNQLRDMDSGLLFWVFRDLQILEGKGH